MEEKITEKYTIKIPIDYDLVDSDSDKPKIRLYGIDNDSIKSELLLKHDFRWDYTYSGDLDMLDYDIKRNINELEEIVVFQNTNKVFLSTTLIGSIIIGLGIFLGISDVTLVGLITTATSIGLCCFNFLLAIQERFYCHGTPIMKRLSFYEKYVEELNKQYEEINKLGFNNSIDFGINFPITKKDIYCTDDLKKYKKVKKEFKKIIKEHKEEIEYIRYQDSIKKLEVLELPEEKVDILGTINEVENRFNPSIENTNTNQVKNLIKK